jgi:ADP-ribosylglycohydrolase
MFIDDDIVSRAQGCLLGQLSGDALGSLVEFRTAEEIRFRYPHGVRDLADGGAWNTIAGQPTDDSEMALALARTLVERGTYDPENARTAYVAWLDSGPFDCGSTVYGGLTGDPSSSSQANGAMMRISPLGIFGAMLPLERVAQWAQLDAALTHSHHVCLDANAVFAMAIAYAISTDVTPEELFAHIENWAREIRVGPAVLNCVQQAANAMPGDYLSHQGWVLIALQNALWQLLHAGSLEEGIIDTVRRGGDTDTNAAITGALFGAVYGAKAVPARWKEKILTCRPELSRPEVARPRPSCYWPVDALDLADQLVRAGLRASTVE